MQKTAEKAMQEVEEGFKVNSPAIRIIKECAIGKGYRQGDIYIYRVPDNHPHGEKVGSRKLAVGQGEGSNHFAEGDIELFEGIAIPSFVKFRNITNPKEFLGPLIKAPKGFKNTHPKHAHCWVEQSGTFQVVFQMDARTLRKVQD